MRRRFPSGRFSATETRLNEGVAWVDEHVNSEMIEGRTGALDCGVPVSGRRYEVKLNVARGELPRVRAWLRTHPAAFAVLYPPRRVNSLYFDTQDLSSLEENLSGVAERTKARVRWYGKRLTPVKGVFEIKRKQGMVGWKHQYSLAGSLLLDRQPWSKITTAIRRDLPEAWARYLDVARCPTVITSYLREYYQTADEAIRATLDFDLRVYDQRRFARPNLRWTTPLADRVIIELKCSAAAHSCLCDVASAFPVRVERCSKFVLGLEATRPC